MITITRNLARQLRAVFRRAGIKAVSSHGPRMFFLAGPDGLQIRAAALDAAVEYQLPGELAREEFSIPLELVELCQGRREDPVTLEVRPGDKVHASWMDAGVPQMHEFDAKAPAGGNNFPEAPTEFVPIGPELWPALRDARESTDPLSSRYALGHLQLRGEQGQVVATDGRQIFQHGGFQFPWSEELLIPGLPVLGCSELAKEPDLAIGRTADQVVLRLGPWTIWLTINKEARFPKMEDILAHAQEGTSNLHLGPADAEFLAKALPKLPCDDQFHGPITIDLNGQIVVRAKGEGEGRTTELVLSNSRLSGEPITISMNRRFLARALHLGFSEVSAKGAEQPVFCADGRRRYIWAVLEPKDVIPASADAVRIESPLATAGGNTTNAKPRGARTTIMSQTTSQTETNDDAATNGHAEANGHATNGHAGAKSQIRRATSRKPGTKTPGTPIEQAVALKGTLRETLLQTNELIRTLKRQKKQSRLVATTLASLKQLQTAG